MTPRLKLVYRDFSDSQQQPQKFTPSLKMDPSQLL